MLVSAIYNKLITIHVLIGSDLSWRCHFTTNRQKVCSSNRRNLCIIYSNYLSEHPHQQISISTKSKFVTNITQLELYIAMMSL